MNTIQWLVEAEVFKEDAQPVLAALEKLGVPHIVCKFGVSYETYAEICKQFPGYTVFYGSHQFAKSMQALSAVQKFEGRSRTIVYCTLPKYDCTYYYPRFGEHLLNSSYALYPFGELERLKDWLFGEYSDSRKVFVRPAACSKVFTGSVVTSERWDVRMRELKVRMEPEELVVVATPRSIYREWRMVVVDNKVVSAGQYKEWGEVVRVLGAPPPVWDFARILLNTVKYRPDGAWVLDICEPVPNHYQVLEVGPFSCSGLYACDVEAVVLAVNELVLKEVG